MSPLFEDTDAPLGDVLQVNLNEPRDEPKEPKEPVGPSFWQSPLSNTVDTITAFDRASGAMIRQGHSIGSVVTEIQNEVPIIQAPDPKYDPFENITGYEDDANAFVHANTDLDVAHVKNAIDEKRKDRETLASSGWAGFASALAVGALDPLFFIPVGGEFVASAKLGTSALRGGLATMKAAALGMTAQETVLQASQINRSLEESATNVALGTLFAGVLGTGVGALAARKAAQDLAPQITRELTIPVGADPMEPGFVWVSPEELLHDTDGLGVASEHGNEAVLAPDEHEPILEHEPEIGEQATLLEQSAPAVSEALPPGVEVAAAGGEVTTPETTLAEVATPPIKAQRPPPYLEPIPRLDIAPDTALTAAGREVGVQYAIVDARSLIPSQTAEGATHDLYPAELQPRDRTRAISAVQIADIAQNLNPRLLDRTPKASDGAPIISPEGVVESGNARSLALRRAYADGLPTAEVYRTYLKEQGYPVDSVEQPVLVRVRTDPMSPDERGAFAREANQSGLMGMSATEQAMSDARSMSDGLLEHYRGGDLDLAQNRPLMRGFLDAVVGKDEHAGMVDREGNYSQDAIRRVHGALLAKAYGDPSLVSAVVESTESNIKAIGGALTDVAPNWARMREAAAKGDIPASADQTPAMLEALRLVRLARQEGRNVAEYVAQPDILSGKSISPEGEAFLGLMFRDRKNWTAPVGRDKLADSLRFYADEALKLKGGPGLFGEMALEPTDVLGAARSRLEKTYGRAEDEAQPDLITQDLVVLDLTSPDLIRGTEIVGENIPEASIERAESFLQGGRGVESAEPTGTVGPDGTVERPLFQRMEGDLPKDPDAEITAWHGTPHEIKGNAFDPRKLGTGEGGAMMGNGLYLAEEPKVADTYRKTNWLSPGSSRQKRIIGEPENDKNLRNLIRDAEERMVTTREKAKRDFQAKFGGKLLSDFDLDHSVHLGEHRGEEKYAFKKDLNLPLQHSFVLWDSEEIRGVLARIHSGNIDPKYVPPELMAAAEPYLNKGHLYRVKVTVKPDELYHYDLPLKDQSPHVQKSVRKAMIDAHGKVASEDGRRIIRNPNISQQDLDRLQSEPLMVMREVAGADREIEVPVDEATGDEIVNYLGRILADSDLTDGNNNAVEAAMRMLSDHGIPGVRYLDQTSRAKGMGTYNIVLFDPKKATITDHYTASGVPNLKDPAWSNAPTRDKLASDVATGATIGDQSIRGKIGDLRFQRLSASATPNEARIIEEFSLNHALSPEFAAKRAEVASAISKELERIGLKDVAVRVADRIADHKGAGFGGYYVAKLITYALNAPQGNVINHEVIHALRNLGYFTDAEWRILAAQAKKEWSKTYAGKLSLYTNETADRLTEEAVAFAHGDWKPPQGDASAIDRIFLAMRDFFGSVANVLRGHGFDTAEKIFQRIESGEIGARGPTGLGATVEQSGIAFARGTGAGDLGAAATNKTEAKLKFALGGEKAIRWSSPGLRLSTSISVASRRAAQELLETPYAYKENALGQSPGPAVETRVKGWNAPLYYSIADLDAAYVKYRTGRAGGRAARMGVQISDLAGRPKGYLSFDQFKELSGKAMRRGDKSDIPEAAAVARNMRAKIFDPLKSDAIEVKVLPKDVKIETAVSYLSRLWNSEKIIAQSPRFLKIVAEWLNREQAAAIRRGMEELKAKYPLLANHATQSEALRIMDAEDRRFVNLTAPEIFDIAEQIKDTLVGTPGGRLPYEAIPVSKVSAGPLKPRTFNIPDELIEDFLESDIEKIARYYVRTMAPDVEMARKFGSADLAEPILKIKDDYAKKSRIAKTKGERTRLNRLRNADLRDLSAMRDRLRGTYGAPGDNILTRTFQVVREWNYSRLLGRMTISSIPDIGNIVMKEGLKRAFGAGLIPLVRSFKSLRLSVSEVKKAGVALDMVQDSRGPSLADLGDMYGRRTKFERASAALARSYGVATLMAPWNAFWKQFVGVLIQDRILTDTRRLASGRISKYSLGRLAESRIDRNMAIKIADQFKRFGVRRGGTNIANTDAWIDREAVTAYRAAIARDVDLSVITPGVGDIPLIANKTEFGKLALQFKTFSMTATQKILLAGLQRRDAATLNGLILSVTLGILVYQIKKRLLGEEPSEDIGTLIMEGIDQSGVMGSLFDINNIAEKLTRGKVGLSRLTDSNEMSRYAARNWIGSILGPSVGAAQDVGTSIAALSNGEATDADKKAMIRLVPFQNLFYLRGLIDNASETDTIH